MPRFPIALLAAAALAPSLIAGDDPLPPGARLRFGTDAYRIGRDLYYADLSPDGADIAWIALGDALIRTDVRTARAVPSLYRLDLMPQARLSFTRDGTRLVTIETGRVNVWDLVSGGKRTTVPAGGVSRDQAWPAVGVSADGKRLVVGRGRDGGRMAYVVWDVDADRAVSEATTPLMNWAYVALSPDGKVFATWGQPEGPPADDSAKTITFWDADAGKVLYRMVLATPAAGRRVCFAPDGKLVLVAGRVIELWDAVGWKRLWSDRGRAGPWPHGNAVAFSPNGKRFAILDADGTVVVRDAETGGNPTVVPGHAPGHALRFVADDRAVVLGGGEFAFAAWEIPSGKPLTPVGRHLDAVRQVRFTADGRHLLSVSEDGELIRWDVATGEPVPGGGLRRPDYADWVGPDDLLEWVSADGARGVFGREWNAVKDRERPARVFDLRARREVFRVARKAEMMWFSNINCSPGGTRLLLNPGCRYGYPTDARMTAVWEPATGKKVFEFPQRDTSTNDTYFSPDDRFLVLLEGTAARVWDAGTGKPVSVCALEGGLERSSAGVSPDGRTLAVAREELPGAVFDLATGRLLLEAAAPRDRPSSPVVFSPDGRLYALGQGWDAAEAGTVQVWEAASGTVRHTFEGHARQVQAGAFSPDGRLLASGGWEGSVVLWDLGAAADDPGLRAAGLARLWERLDDTDAARAYPALRELVRRPAEAVGLIAGAIDPASVTPPGPAAVRAMIAKLDSAGFAEREAAGRELSRLGREVLPAVMEAAGTATPEARRRLEEVARRVRAAGVNRDVLRAARAVEVLERIGSSEAREVLRSFAAGEATHPLAEASRAALRRLASK